MSVDNRATRAHIAASRGYLHEYLSTDALLTDEIADALMRDVAGKLAQFDTGESYGPAAVFGVTDRTGKPFSCVLAPRDPWGNDPDRTTRNWRPETAA